MYYDFLNFMDLDFGAILQQMKKLATNKDDIPMDPINVLKMILYMMLRKEEELYKQINPKNLARHLVSFIPTESFEEIEKKAALNEPVRFNIFGDYYFLNKFRYILLF